MDLLSRLTRIEREELSAVLWAATLFFFLLCSYYILRPMREAMGIAGGTRQLPNLYLVTLGVTLLVTPLFGWMTRRYDKRKFLPYTYRFFGVNLLLFLVAWKMLPESTMLWVGRAFYVWISVFNMFLISLFWAFMADGFGLAQSKRLFGAIAVGGSLGAAFGAGITRFFISIVGQSWLVLISVVLLEIAVQVVGRLRQRFDEMGPPPDAPPELPKERPSVWEGLQLTLRSPYLGGIALFLFFYSSSSTFLYFTQAEIVSAAESATNARVERFADIDLWVNICAVTMQLFVTSRIMTRLGVSVALVILPLLTAIGFAVLGATPTMTVLILFQVARRSVNYAVMRPARETLFTVLSTAEKYKAKSFLDTFVYRGGDAVSAKVFDLLRAAGLGLGVLAGIAVPLAFIWGGVGIYLGRKQKALAKEFS